MDWLKRFMMGRYGGDQLSLVLLILSFILTFLAWLSGYAILVYLSYIPLWICIFRMFSRNVEKRRMENYRFAMLMSPVYSRLKKMQSRIRDLRTYRFFKCPNCKAMLRVPRGKGKIRITCPKCKTEFRGKS